MDDHTHISAISLCYWAYAHVNVIRIIRGRLVLGAIMSACYICCRTFPLELPLRIFPHSPPTST